MPMKPATTSSVDRVDVFVRGADSLPYVQSWLGAGWLGYRAVANGNAAIQ